MKTISMISKSLFFGLFLLMTTGLYAQDAVKVSPKEFKKVLLDNEKVRVIQVEFAPGVASEWHSHPAYVVYVISDGKMEMTEKGKKTVVNILKSGEANYNMPVTHMAKNVGTTTVKLVLVEMKPMHKMMKGESMKKEAPAKM